MKRHWMGVLALAGTMAIAWTPLTASAQRLAKNVYPKGSSAAANAQFVRMAQAQRVEPLPQGNARTPQLAPGQGDPFVDEPQRGPYSPDDYQGGGYAGGCQDGCCNDGYFDDGYYSSCGPDGCSTGGCCVGGGGGCCGNGAGSPSGIYVIADYLYVRSSFSEATAFMQTNFEQGNGVNLTTLNVNQMDFQYNSSFRVGGGVKLGECCNQRVRFLYTRLTSDAALDIAVDDDILIPYEVAFPPGVERALINGDVDVQSYDLDCSKTILLGGEQCCQCGDCCDPCGGDGCDGGCGDCCAPRCPAWDVTYSGGIRVADADWARNYAGIDEDGDVVRNASIAMDYEGVGPKISLEGRRYFGNAGSISLYAKGDLSVLVGDYELNAVRTTEGGTAPDTVTLQTFRSRAVIPVTELEGGVSGQLTRTSRITAGYLVSAWHDLGFRDEFDDLNPNFPLRYDDANILGFDGFFARFEWNY